MCVLNTPTQPCEVSESHCYVRTSCELGTCVCVCARVSQTHPEHAFLRVGTEPNTFHATARLSKAFRIVNGVDVDAVATDLRHSTTKQQLS